MVKVETSMLRRFHRDRRKSLNVKAAALKPLEGDVGEHLHLLGIRNNFQKRHRKVFIIREETDKLDSRWVECDVWGHRGSGASYEAGCRL